MVENTANFQHSPLIRENVIQDITAHQEWTQPHLQVIILVLEESARMDTTVPEDQLSQYHVPVGHTARVNVRQTAVSAL